MIRCTRTPLLGLMLLFLWCPWVGQADDTAFVIMPYYISTDHDEDVGRSGSGDFGIYAYLGKGNVSLEVEYDDWSNDNDVDQTYLLGVLTYYTPHWTFRGGYHEVDQEIPGFDDEPGEVILGGISYSGLTEAGLPQWTVGLDVFDSSYDTADDLEVLQWSPFLTGYFSIKAWGGYASWTLASDIIDFNEVAYREDSFFMGRVELAQHWEKVSLEFDAWFGEASYWLKDRGFLLFNTADELNDGFGLGLTWRATEILSFKGLVEHYYFTSSTGLGDGSFQRLGAYMGLRF